MVVDRKRFAPVHVGEFDRWPVDLSVDQVLWKSIESVGRLHARSRYDQVAELPPLPPRGAGAEELAELEASLGAQLPADYRSLLSRVRYVQIDDNLSIHGLDWEGVTYGAPWISTNHPVPGRALVFGAYGRFADGDQLLLLLDVADQPVVAFLHEHGPSVEYFAPSILFALWRMVHE